MLKTYCTTLSLLKSPLQVGYILPLLQLQQKRNRKPSYLPRAPSKMYKINQRFRVPPDELAEHLRLHKDYKSTMKMIYDHMKLEYPRHQEKAVDFIDDDDEHQLAMELNEQENERVAALREQRLAEDFERRKEEIAALKVEAEKESEKEIEEALQILEETKERAKHFIEPENLRKEIEKAMNTPTDFNYSIDVYGRRYKGKFTKPAEVDPKTLERLEVKEYEYTNVF